MWTLKHGKTADQIEEQAEANNMPLPPHLENKPELGLGLGFYWEAFWSISSCRPQGVGPIEWTAIDSYARRYKIVGYEFERLVAIINKLDEAFMNYSSQKVETNRNKGLKHKAKKPLGGKMKMKK